MKQAARRSLGTTSISPVLLVGLIAVSLLLAGIDYIELIPGFSNETASLPFQIIHDSHDILAVALAVYIAWRALPKLGAALIVLFMVVHAPYYYIQVPSDLPEVVHLLVLGAAGLIGIALIADRRRAYDLFQQIGAASPIGIYIVQDGKFRYVNPRFQRIVGCAESELLHRDPLELVHPEDASRVRQTAVARLKSESSDPYEFRVITKDKGTKWILETVTSVQYLGRRAALGNFMDITERKRGQVALQESEKRYRSLFDNMLGGLAYCQMLVKDNRPDDFVYLEVNGAFEKLTGLKDVVGRKVTEVIPGIKESNPELFEIYGRVAATGRPESFETYVGPLQIWLSLSVYSPATGYFAAIFDNITERKRMEAELRRSEENFRRSLDESPLPIRIFKRGGERTAWANRLFLDLYGCDSLEEFNATPPEKRYTPESYAKYEQRRERWRRSDFVPSANEMSVVRKNGDIRQVQIFRNEVLWNGEPHLQHVCQDITERYQMQEQLIMTDRLASIGELAAGVAHELNNPLTSVIGFSQLLMEREIPDDIKEDLGLVYSEAQRAADIVKNLLTFARKHAPVKQLCQIHDVIEDVLRLRAHEQTVNNIEVDRRFAPDLPGITVDYFQMQQVFFNIIINAEYFMAEAHHKGTLTITTSRLDDTVSISFADDGPGISQEHQGQLFNPFFTTKGVGRGTGLGLSISHGIVSEHGGSIYARSHAGEGATFVVELPVNGRRAKLEVPHG